jgi:hypothetical protein
MKLYKLTDENGCTRGNTQWGEGVKHVAIGTKDGPLCSDSWIHAYEHPLLAVLLNRIHADFCSPQLWEAKGRIGKRDGQLKCCCRSLTTIRRMELPTITAEQRVRFAIACAWPQYTHRGWRAWALDWLSGKDRSKRAAAGARAAAAWAGAGAAAAMAAEAAGERAMAAEAARAAARAIAAAAAAMAAEAAGEAARADAAAWAAARAMAAAAEDFDLITCAEWAITDNSITELYVGA